jgi:hypothetical protein
MDNNGNVVKQISWGETFGFLNIFKTFRMAMHPSKLALGVMALVLIFGGGFILDQVWGMLGGTVKENEVFEHVTMPRDKFEAKKEAWQDGRLAAAAQLLAAARAEEKDLLSFKSASLKGSAYLSRAFVEKLNEYNKNNKYTLTSAAKELEEAKDEKKDWGDLLGEADDAFDNEIEKIEKFLDDDIEDKALKLISEDKNLKDEDKKKEKDKLDEALVNAWKGVSDRVLQYERQKKAIEGAGVFESFIAYEKGCLYNAIVSLRYLNFTGGMAEYQKCLDAKRGPAMNVTVGSGLPEDPATAAPPNDSPGFFFYMCLACEGVCWLLSEHCVFGVVFLIWCLAVWALFGGAIHRIAAIQFAREEKISAFQALGFAKQKLLSFFSAPLVPVMCILFLGLLLTVGGLIGSIPVIGPFLMSLLFLLAIIFGIGVAFMVVGYVAGFGLMYPTMAVEGSDSFDAISRSFNYVFARPFHALFYGLVAAVYGMITYLFVRLFAFIILGSIHYFVSWGVIGGGSRMGAGADKLDVLWKEPSFWNLHEFNWAAMGSWEAVCAVILAVSVYLVVATVAAYLLTFFASGTTVIYYLLRRHVDVTEIDDVYIEEEEEMPAMGDDALDLDEEAPAGEKAEPEPEPEEEKAEEEKAEEKKAAPKKKAKKKAKKKKKATKKKKKST